MANSLDKSQFTFHSTRVPASVNLSIIDGPRVQTAAESIFEAGRAKSSTEVPVGALPGIASVGGNATALGFVAEHDDTKDVALGDIQACRDCDISVYSCGGCHPARAQRRRAGRMNSLFKRKATTVARPDGVRPIVLLPSSLQRKWSDHV